MHNTNKFLEQYVDAVTMFYEQMNDYNFPIERLNEKQDSEPLEGFLTDAEDNSYSYDLEYNIFLSDDDEEPTNVQLTLYSQFIFFENQTFKLSIMVNGVELTDEEDIREFAALMNDDDATLEDIDSFLERVVVATVPDIVHVESTETESIESVYYEPPASKNQTLH